MEWFKVWAPGEVSRTEECTFLTAGFREMGLEWQKVVKGRRAAGGLSGSWENLLPNLQLPCW